MSVAVNVAMKSGLISSPNQEAHQLPPLPPLAQRTVMIERLCHGCHLRFEIELMEAEYDRVIVGHREPRDLVVLNIMARCKCSECRDEE